MNWKTLRLVIFVVDSNDKEPVGQARYLCCELQPFLPLAFPKLQKMLAEDDELRDAVVLVKQDLPNAMNSAELTDKLGLRSLAGRQWYGDKLVSKLVSILAMLQV